MLHRKPMTLPRFMRHEERSEIRCELEEFRVLSEMRKNVDEGDARIRRKIECHVMRY